MKNMIVCIFCLFSFIIVITTAQFTQASAHSLTSWANYYPAINAGGGNHFGMMDSYHIEGRIGNYYWENTTVKNYFKVALTQGASFWGGMIDVVEVAPSNASFVIKYNPNISSNAAAYVLTYMPSHGHYAANELTTEMVIGNITNYTAKEKSQVLAHELGHLWGIADLYKNNTNLESIYSQVYKFTSATRHDKNAMYIGQDRPWYQDSSGNWKYLKSPGVFAVNELIYTVGYKPSASSKDYYYFNSNGVLVNNSSHLDDGGIYIIKCKYDNKYLNVQNGIYESGNNVWPHADAHQWKAIRQTDGSYEFAPVNDTRLRLNVDVANNNVNIKTDDDSDSMRWVLINQGDGYSLTPKISTNKVLDNNTVNNVYINQNVNYSNQRWYFEKVGDSDSLENNSIYTIKCQYDGKYLNVQNGIYESGNNVWPHADAHQWKAIRQTDGSYEFAPVNDTRLRLNVDGVDANGTNVNIATDNDSNSMRWVVIKHGDSYSLRPKISTNRVLDNNFADNVWIWANSNVNNQRWYFDKVGNSDNLLSGRTYTIKSNIDDKYLSVENANYIAGNNVCINSTAQQWKVIRQTDGSYEIAPVNNSLLRLGVAGGDVNKSNVYLQTDNNNNSIRWVVIKHGDSYSLRPKISTNRVLDNNTIGNAWIWENTNFSNQRWTFNLVS